MDGVKHFFKRTSTKGSKFQMNVFLEPLLQCHSMQLPIWRFHVHVNLPGLLTLCLFTVASDSVLVDSHLASDSNADKTKPHRQLHQLRRPDLGLAREASTLFKQQAPVGAAKKSPLTSAQGRAALPTLSD